MVDTEPRPSIGPILSYPPSGPGKAIVSAGRWGGGGFLFSLRFVQGLGLGIEWLALVAARRRVGHAFPDSEESRTEHLGAGRLWLWAWSPLSYLAALPVHPVEP